MIINFLIIIQNEYEERTKETEKYLIRIAGIGAALCASGLLLLFGINGYVKYNARKSILSQGTLAGIKDYKADAVLVLGAQVKQDGQMSIMLKERVDKGIELYKAGLTDRMIMSGDHGREAYDEVNTMKDYAISQGVPSECIFMDHAGFSTYDSMYRAKEIFQAEEIIVVTQKYHLPRAVYDGEALGLKVKGISCDKAVYAGDTYRKAREMLARAKDFGYTIVKPKPTYLGEAVPVSGNGDVTNDKE